MAGKDKGLIVIKKITIDGGAAHGGAWKVAFADFMTAMMCFFLVMWLLNQTPEVRKQVASHFSGPSMIEQQLTSYGAELTLEKLFLDMVNEPLKTIQDFMQPADFTPNLVQMGSRKVILHTIANEIGEIAKNVKVTEEEISFEIEDRWLFVPGTAQPTGQYESTMKRITMLTIGLEDSLVEVNSELYKEAMEDQSVISAKNVAQNRADIIRNQIASNFESETMRATSKSEVPTLLKAPKTGRPYGTIKIRILPNEKGESRDHGKRFDDLFDDKRRSDMSIYDDYVRQIGKDKKRK